MNPFRLARSNPQERVREQRTKSDSSGRGEFEAPPPFALTPLTGRDTEFSLLKDRWEQAQEGMGQVLLVVGQPGLGKSRLVQTLTQRVQAQASDASLSSGWRIRERVGRPGFSGHRMALLTTFPKLGASPGVGLSGALSRGRARSITDGSLRPIGAASGGLRSVQAGARWRYLPSCYFCRRTSAIRGPASRPPESVRRPFARWANGCARTPASGRSC